MSKRFVLAFGVILFIIGVIGLVPLAAPGGQLFGVFTVDVMDSAIYIASGILALTAAWAGRPYPRLYFKVFGVVFTVIAVVGLLQGDTVLGLMAINGWDNALNLLVALAALWAGFGASERSVQMTL